MTRAQVTAAARAFTDALDALVTAGQALADLEDRAVISPYLLICRATAAIVRRLERLKRDATDGNA